MANSSLFNQIRSGYKFKPSLLCLAIVGVLYSGVSVAGPYNYINSGFKKVTNDDGTYTFTDKESSKVFTSKYTSDGLSQSIELDIDYNPADSYSTSKYNGIITYFVQDQVPDGLDYFTLNFSDDVTLGPLNEYANWPTLGVAYGKHATINLNNDKTLTLGYTPGSYNTRGSISVTDDATLNINAGKVVAFAEGAYEFDPDQAIVYLNTNAIVSVPGTPASSAGGLYVKAGSFSVISKLTTPSEYIRGIYNRKGLAKFEVNEFIINKDNDAQSQGFAYGIVNAGNATTEIKAQQLQINATTAISSQDANSFVDVLAQNAVLNGSIEAYGGSTISFKRYDAFSGQQVEIYSNTKDAVLGQPEDSPLTTKANINFNVNTIINSQENYSTEYADLSGVRTVSAIRALRLSEINLNTAESKYQIYGDIIAGRGVEAGSSHGSDQGGIINIGGTGSVVRGDVLAGNSGIITLELNNGSFEGRVDDYADASLDGTVFRPQEFDVEVSEGGRVNLSLNGNSRWDARNQSFVTSLNFGEGNSAVVDLTKDDSSSITIRNLTGNGTFNIKLNSVNHSQGHMLYIGKNEGNQTINIIGGIEGGVENISEDNPLRFATVGIDAGALPEVNGISNTRIRAFTRDAGMWDLEYIVEKETFDKNDVENEEYNGSGNGEGVNKPGNDFVENALVGDRKDAVDWQIVGVKAPEEPDTPVTPEDPTGPSGTHISDAAKTVINMSRANYANAVYMDTLNKRHGEARYSMGQDNGVWVRLRHDNIGKDDSFRTHNTMVEVGFEQRDVNDYGEFHTGFALDYMNGQIDYHTVDGDGDIERYGAWFYTTFLGNDGQYADLVLKYGHLKNDFGFNTKTQGEHVTGDYTNEVASISAEYGWKFSNSYNYYIEPQVQLQYSYVTGADYTTSQGSKVDLDSIHSLIGRVGFRAGKDFNTETPITAYIRGDVLHEFLGDQDIRAYDNTGVFDATYENDDTWYSAGVGLSVMTSQNTYFYIEGEQVFGADNEDTYTVSGGFRHSF